jgi:uncharacterized damage-inducible protein DinB
LFTLDGIRKFHQWTHACLNVALDYLATIPATDYAKEVPGFGFPTLRHQVLHILNCEGVWVHRLRGIAYTDRKPADFPGIADARLMQREVSDQTLAYLASLTDRQLNLDTEVRISDEDTAFRTPAFVLHHVFTHTFHHKGQIVAMCRVLGHPAPYSDLIQFE